MNARYRRLGWLAVGLLIGVVVTQIITATLRTSQMVRSNSEVLETVKSCTTPGRECYERSRRQTATAVASINTITILAAACADRNPGDVKKIEACVRREFAASERARNGAR